MIKVLKPGLNTSIQDLGRFGYRNQGVPNSGCMDLISAGLANLLIENSICNAVLEITLMGPKLLFLTDSIIVITGADMSPKINSTTIYNYKPYKIYEGDILSFGRLLCGTRSYLAVKNGILSEIKLNSRSQFNAITNSCRLKKNEMLEINNECSDFKINNGVIKNKIQFFETDEIEVMRGPEFGLLSKKEIYKLTNQTYTVSKDNNRMGYQMEEIVAPHTISMITSPVIPGTVQLLPSGKIIILMKDAQTTGGYPRIFQLTELSISVLAQKKVGDMFKIKLSPTTHI